MKQLISNGIRFQLDAEPQLPEEDPGHYRRPKSRSTSTQGWTFPLMITSGGPHPYAIQKSSLMLIRI